VAAVARWASGIAGVAVTFDTFKNTNDVSNNFIGVASETMPAASRSVVSRVGLAATNASTG